ncbi:MAG: DUF4249 family protein [Bacteroidales bacterium]|nr:DUF4249 family protein [Bacteroidales bacterium]
MSRIKSFLIVTILMMCTFSSCEPELELTADWKDVTIVHGYLKEGHLMGGACIVRVKKAFLGEENAYEMASELDTTIYKEPVEVTIQEIFNGFTTEYQMTPGVYSRDSGLFPQENNIWWLEEGELAIDSKKEYKIIVYFPERDKYVTAQTNVIPSITLAKPSYQRNPLYFTDPDYPFTMVYYTQTYAEFYQFKIKFHYVDHIQDTIMIHHTLEWNLEPDIVSPAPTPEDYCEVMKKQLSYQSIYGFLASNIPEDTTLIARYLKSIDVRLFASTHEYNLYYHSGKDFEFGSSRKPYTNIVNGEGIFTSYAWREVDSLFPEQTSMDSLAFGQLTRHLKFSNTRYSDE